MGDSKTDYAKIKIDRPELFAAKDGEPIRLLTESAEVLGAEQASWGRLQAKGLPLKWGEVGCVFEDQYLQILRDAVEFSNGTKGTYIRVITKPFNSCGAAVLPIFQGQIVMLRHFRHATRCWLYEIPRGFGEPGEDAEATARREIEEEIQGEIQEIRPLGAMHPNSGLSTEKVELFFARVKSIGACENGVGIEGSELWTPDEFETRLRGGQIADSFTLAAWAMAKAKGHV